jgi:hypothetical protein
MSEHVPSEVGRVLARDDLLTLAAAADQAVDIVARMDWDGRTLFAMALEQQLRLADEHPEWAVRSQALDHAAVLVRFAAMVGEDPGTELTAEELHERALHELRDRDSDFVLDRDMAIGVFNRYHAARNYRLIGAWDKARRLVKRPVTDLFGAGAEPHAAHYQYEVGAAYIQQGRAREIRRALQEHDAYWNHTRAADYSTRHRFVFIKALTEWAVDPDGEAVGRLLRDASDLLRDNRVADARDEDVRELSVLMATAEYLAGRNPSAEQVAEAVRLGGRALTIANEIRARWKVLVRSRAPLAVVFERVYGDLALLADRLAGPDAAELGCRVAISAKQTGFAVRVRDGLTFEDNQTIQQILDEIVEIEGSAADTYTDNPKTRAAQLQRLRRELADDVSPMLADTVFPPPADLSGIVTALGPRYALDFVELRDTLANEPRLFRTLIEPGGRVSFDCCPPPGTFRDFYRRNRAAGGLTHEIAAAAEAARASRAGMRDFEDSSGPETDSSGPETDSSGPETDSSGPETDSFRPEIDWRGLAEAILPERLTREILGAADAAPVQLLISAHSWLSLIPWAALKIDDDGHRLVERATIAQTPVLTCLTGVLPSAVTGAALLRLVGIDEGGVNVHQERRAWGFPGGTDGIPPHRCELRPGEERPQPERYPGRFAQALTTKDAWQFLHIASHGHGKGFNQSLNLGAGEEISAAQALGLKWPTAVLMASCHVGLVENDNGREPLSFVMALLTGGAQCVVAGIDRIADEGTGYVASQIVGLIRDCGVSLDVALRNAQLAAVKNHEAEEGWALLSAYVR